MGSTVKKVATKQNRGKTGTTVKIRKPAAGNPAPLFRKSGLINDVLPAGISLDNNTGDLRGFIGTGLGGASIGVFQGSEQEFDVTPYLSNSKLVKVLEEIKPMAQRVIDGYSLEYGPNDFHAEFTADANAARNEIMEYLDAVEGDIICLTASDYMSFDEEGLRGTWDGQTLEEAVAKQEAAVKESGMVVVGDIEAEILGQAFSQFESYPETLGDNHVRELLNRGLITRKDVELWRGEMGDAE